MKDFAVSIAKRAGEYLLENFRKDLSLVKERGVAKEITTRYDKESDRIIKEAISDRYPDHSILTEESEFIDHDSDYLWIVDPLDGTSNFALGNPFFAVSIALMHKGELVLGVVYAPFLDELFFAEKGKGSTLNGKVIRVSEQNNLGKSYILACEGGEPDTENIGKLVARLYPKVKDLRKLGSAAIEGCFVACGRADAYITFKIRAWDIAAAILIVQEAGGKVTDFKSKDWRPKPLNVVLSNGKVHESILKIV